MVADNWPSNISMTETLTEFTKATDTWNKTVFGYIGTKKKILMALIRGIQKSLSSHSSRFLRKLEFELLIELEHLLDQEELLWKKKSRSDWITQGDHDQTLQEEVVCYFTSIFSSNSTPATPYPTTVMFPHIPTELMQHLDDIPSDEEIHAALCDMTPLKSPG
ncbi:hypothetical protein V6N13_037572 [Hibiscus sabdariffa]